MVEMKISDAATADHRNRATKMKFANTKGVSAEFRPLFPLFPSSGDRIAELHYLSGPYMGFLSGPRLPGD